MIRAWLVDDEPLAVKRLRRMLEETGKVDVVGSNSNPAEALNALAGATLDALFLDIEMPGMNGFELLRQLSVKPAVVFTTAFDQYAVKAFEADGVDYLLKPVSPEALDRAISKLERTAGLPPVDYLKVVERLTRALREPARDYPRRLPSRLGDRVLFIDLEKVTHFFSEGKLTWASTPGKNYVIDDSITQLEEKLDPAKFLRIHRAHLVNLSSVAETGSWFGGKMVARLNDPAKTELPVARDRVRALKDRLGF